MSHVIPLNHREEVILELEELGYDDKHPTDYDWRAHMTNEELEAALDAFKAELKAQSEPDFWS